MPDLYRFFSLGAAAACLVCALAGCDSFGEPSRFIDDSVQPPSVSALDVTELTPGQHVAGELAITLDLDSLGSRVQEVVFVIDNYEVQRLSDPPFVYHLDTRDWDEGPHDLSVGVYLHGNDLGLLGLVGVPPILFGTSLIFDQTPPTPVAVTSAVWTEDGARVTWEESRDPNFYAYLVIRYSNWAPYVPSDWNYPVVDTVFDRSATTYLDWEMPRLYGAWSGYHVAVWNRAEATEISEEQEVRYGTERSDLRPRHRALFNPARDVMYAISPEDELIAVRTATNEILRSVNPQSLGGPHASFDTIVPSPDGTQLYVATGGVRQEYGTRLFVFDAATFDLLYTVDPPLGAYRVAVGADERAYTITEGDFGRANLSVFDRVTGDVLYFEEDAFSNPSHVMGVSPDGRSLYVFERLHADAQVLHRYDLSEGRFDAVAQYGFDGGYGIGNDYDIGPDGRVYLRIGEDTVEMLDGLTFEVQNHLTLDLPHHEEIALFQATPSRLYVGIDRRFNIDEEYPSIDGRVIEFDLDGLQRLRSWDFIPRVTGLTTSGQHHLFVGTYNYVTARGWVIPL